MVFVVDREVAYSSLSQAVCCGYVQRVQHPQREGRMVEAGVSGQEGRGCFLAGVGTMLGGRPEACEVCCV